jgi:hypothetical protein
VIEGAYRLLGAVLLARRALVAGTALVGVALWYQVVHEVASAASAASVLAMVALPLLLGCAAWRLFQLAPGVVFRPLAAAADPAPQRTARCHASAYFEGRTKTAWRLLARSSIAFGSDGTLLLVSPPPLRAGPEETRQAFPTRGQPTAAQLRAGERTPYPEWVYQPETLVGASRLVYQSAADYARAVARLAIGPGALVAVQPGWQYAGLQRWPAIRLSYHGADGALSAAYLAFSDASQRAWALAALLGRRGGLPG